MTLPFETLDVPAIEAKSDERIHALRAFAAEGGSFWESLYGQWNTYGGLSDRQMACIEREMDKRAQRAEGDATIETAPLGDMVARFSMAGAHIKRPAIILTDHDGEKEYRFQPAPEGGANAGWIYVKTRGETDWGWGWAYRAKINPANGELWAARGQSARDLVQAVRSMLADGLDAAVLHYGHKTSNCGLCARPLTEELSVKSGVGPVCADRYGIDRTALIQA